MGQIDYGVRFKIWSPSLTHSFGPQFNTAVRTLLACQRSAESPVALLPDECLYYILHLCKWDWFQDAAAALKEKRRARQKRERAAAVAAATATGTVPMARQVTQETQEQQQQHRGASEEEVAAMDEDTQHAQAADDTEMNEQEEDDDDEEEENEWVEEQEEDSDSDESAWERQHGYRANTQLFVFHDVSSDEEDEQGDDEQNAEEAAAERQAWFRRHFARIHILRALAQAEDANNDPQQQDGDGEDDVMGYDSIADSSNDEDEEAAEAILPDENYVPLQDTDDEE